nr:bZIP transcription factor 44-like [Ipomoea batatas]
MALERPIREVSDVVLATEDTPGYRPTHDRPRSDGALWKFAQSDSADADQPKVLLRDSRFKASEFSGVNTMAYSSGNSSGSTQLTNSGSEEDLQLMAQAAALKKENAQILSKISSTARDFMNVEAENSVLRAQMMELSQRLQFWCSQLDLEVCGGALLGC